ncbi:hypothetical protein O2W14_11325 [Modestobacter sp. VKM Ac-2986]|uniref:hypothetical protein n=1 Tax=Modestobacter sp. VKM Ac-2986 TaxID=3004140 RepID=UPI0022AB8C32|nr:hypothetical protein [Modestobacter sp. VKM Ac-2986]MCZ2829425.1 hypothetical protein [Modestobacter sp. VKM Ac-2986]
MSRMSRPRAAVAAGLTLGATAASMFLAPAAFAATEPVFEASNGVVTGPKSVSAGATFTLSGTECTYDTNPDSAGDADLLPAGVLIDIAPEAEDSDDTIFGAESDMDGNWTAEVLFPADTPAGEYTIELGCIKSYNGGELIRGEEYMPFTLLVTAPTAVQPVNNPGTPTASPTASPAATTPAAAFKPGAKPNTPGVSSTTTDKTTGAAAAPGQKVVKVLKGFKAGEKVTVVLHSDPVVLGAFTADANGVVTVEFTVPAGTPLGNHTIAYTGDQGTYFEEALQLTADGKALAYTGASIAMPLIGGSVLLAAGAGAMVVGRRRRSTGAAQA